VGRGHTNSFLFLFFRSYTSNTKNLDNYTKFFEWLSGLIDGDGYFHISKINGLASLIITFDSRDLSIALMLQKKLGGSYIICKRKKCN